MTISSFRSRRSITRILALTGVSLSLGAPALEGAWATSAEGCHANGYNTAVKATGGPHAGLWKCSNTIGGPGGDADAETFSLEAMLDINAFVNSTPDFEQTTFERAGLTYLLVAGDEGGVRIIYVGADGFVAGVFGEDAIAGSVETSAIGLNGTGDPSGGRYHVYSGLITGPPTCDADVDGDGDTDVLDFGAFAPLFGQSVPAGQVPDFDGDGSITVFDFATLIGDYGCIP